MVEHDRAVLDWYLEEYGTERMETEMTQDQGEGETAQNFTSSEIDDTLFQRMNGKSYVENPDIFSG